MGKFLFCYRGLSMLHSIANFIFEKSKTVSFIKKVAAFTFLMVGVVIYLMVAAFVWLYQEKGALTAFAVFIPYLALSFLTSRPSYKKFKVFNLFVLYSIFFYCWYYGPFVSGTVLFVYFVLLVLFKLYQLLFSIGKNNAAKLSTP